MTRGGDPGPGPSVVRGASIVADAAGELHPVRRPVVALCGCGRSAALPWCDSTHKALRTTGPRAVRDTGATEASEATAT